MVEAISHTYLAGFAQAFTSNLNVGPALVMMWISLVGVGIVAIWLFIRSLVSANRTMAQRTSPPQKPSPALGD